MVGGVNENEFVYLKPVILILRMPKMLIWDSRFIILIDKLKQLVYESRFLNDTILFKINIICTCSNIVMNVALFQLNKYIYLNFS